MAQEYVHQFMVKLMGMDLVLMMEDTVYIMKRQDHPQQFKPKVQQLRDRYKNSMIMGGSFGLALLFSLRRYFPSTFGTFSMNRLLIELTILGGSLIGSTLSVVMGSAKVVHYLKKEYVVEADRDVYSYMDEIDRKYHLNEEDQVRYLLSNEEYQDWKKIRKSTFENKYNLL